MFLPFNFLFTKGAAEGACEIVLDEEKWMEQNNFDDLHLILDIKMYILFSCLTNKELAIYSKWNKTAYKMLAFC